MKTFTIFFIAFLAAGLSVKAQNLITVQHAGTPTFYTDLPTAITKTVAGDTVYIPGGSYPAITIAKKLSLIGVGANPDSTKTTGRTMVTGITLNTGADGGSITGVYTYGSGIFIGSKITGFNISRSYVVQLADNGTAQTKAFTITNNIIGNLFLGKGTKHYLSNNLFTNTVSINTSSITFDTDSSNYVRNNLFLFANGGDLLAGQNSIVENNIFVTELGSPYVGESGFFNNNINAGINGASGSNNYSGVSISTLFPTFNSSILTTDGIFEVNFNLPVGSPYKNAGTDGTDIGIYGGAYPWKNGSLPPNPHFQSVTVGPTTDSSGNLKVQITVEAQNN